MVKLSRIEFPLLGCLFLLLTSLNVSLLGQDNELENNISKAVANVIPSENVIVKASFDKSKKITSLIIKLEKAGIGGITADYMTIQLRKPVIDISSLKKSGKFRLISSNEKKISILLSIKNLQQYLAAKANEFGKKNANIKLKFSPPYIECFYNVPKKEIASETIGLLSKFIPGDKLEGYAAFTLTINKNELSAHSSKVILNHFLLPNTILNIFENRFNPFDKIIPIGIVDYKINKLNVQAKYILLSN